MLFSSISFLYYFLPIVLLIYFITPKKLKNSVLLISSLVFYGWGEPKLLFLMALTILTGYFAGLLIEKSRSKPLSKVCLFTASAIFLGILAYFKYANFFIENFAYLTGINITALKVTLPIGISFYTFQILSYVIDVYRKKVPCQKNIINLGAYIALFPQLIAGPIVRYSHIERELRERTHSFDKIASGIRRFIFGLSKKVIIANSLGVFCNAFLNSDQKSVAFYWLYAICYALQIYFDFSGYSDMAIGLGKILGFDFQENFNYPYISKSITEFWRRWHISLGSWFRDYVYIPLGGNRVGKIRHIVNIFTVWLLTGLWHGAEWNFIIWGIYFGVLLVIEKFFLLKHLEKHRIISHIYVVFLVVISFVIFSGNNMTQALELLCPMFGFGDVPLVSEGFIYYFESSLVTILLALFLSTGAVKKLNEKIRKSRRLSIVADALEIPFLLCLLVIVTAYLADSSFNPFLYFRF